MYNDEAILKIAAYNLDSDDIVKAAGAVQSIKNWLKRMFSPEYRERVNQLKDRSERLQVLLSDLVTATNNVENSVRNADSASYEKHLGEVKLLVGYLNKELDLMGETAEQASVKKPKPETSSKYMEDHTTGYDMPMGTNLDIPFNELSHLKDLEIKMSNKANEFSFKKWIGKKLKDAGYPMEVFASSDALNLFFKSIKEAIPDGILVSNVYSSQRYTPFKGAEYGHTRIKIKTPVDIPKLSLHFVAEVVLSDRSSQANNPEQSLSAFRIRIDDVEYSGDVPNVIPQSGEGKRVVFLAVSKYLNDDKSKQDIVDKKNELKKLYNTDNVEEVSMNELDNRSKFYEEQGYQVIKEEFIPKAASRKDFLIKVAEESSPWWEGFGDIKGFIEGKSTKAPVKKVPTRNTTNSTKIWMKTDRHIWARDILKAAFIKVMGRESTPAEIQLIQSVAMGESSYGRGWKGPMANSKNWGAIQYTGGPNRGKPINGICPTGSAPQVDSKPTRSGESTKFTWCYKVYNTHEDGAADLIKTVFKHGKKPGSRAMGTLEAAESGSLRDFSKVMYDTKYYGSKGKTDGERIAWHVIMMNGNLNTINSALNEKSALGDAISYKELNHAKIAKQINDKINNVATTTTVTDNSALKSLEFLLWSNDSRLNVVVKNAIAKKVLPKTDLLIVTKNASDEYIDLVCKSLNRIIGAETKVENNKITCSVPGDEKVVTGAVQAVCDCVSDKFEIVDSQVIKTAIYPFVSLKRIG